VGFAPFDITSNKSNSTLWHTVNRQKQSDSKVKVLRVTGTCKDHAVLSSKSKKNVWFAIVFR
jgi:hypothetical protein